MSQPLRLVSSRFLLLLALPLLATPLAAQAPTTPTAATTATPQEGPPPPTLAQARAEALRLDFVAARATREALLRQAKAELDALRHPADPTAELDTAAIAAKLAEIEWMLSRYQSTDALDDHQEVNAFMDSLGLAPATDGLAWARSNDWQLDRVERYALLTAWSFVGPFDNERGAAFLQPLPPEGEADPQAVYAGAEREVAWRTLPHPVPLEGVLDFGELLRPNHQIALIARTWVYCDQDQEALFLFGIDGEAKLWHDGSAVFQALGRHESRHDALAAPLALHAGWNELALKLGSRDHTPTLFARLVDADTLAPLRLRDSATLPEGQFAFTLEAAEPSAAADKLPPGARGYYQALTFAAPEDVQAWRRLGELQMAYKDRPKAEHPGRDTLQQAASLAPEDPAVAIALLNELMPEDDSAEIDLNPWLTQWRHCQALVGEVAFLDMQRLLVNLRYQHLQAEAQRQADAMLAHSDQAPLAQFFRLAAAKTFKQDAVADHWGRQLLADARTQAYPRLLSIAARSLPRADPRRLETLEQAYLRFQDEVILEPLLELRHDLGLRADRDSILADLERWRRHLPWQIGPILDAARQLQSMGEFETAMALTATAQQLCPDAPRPYALAARLHLAQGNQEAAITALEQELERDFNADDEQRLLDYLRQQDGASFEAPFRESLASLIERMPPADPEQGLGGAAYEYLQVSEVVEVHPDATANRYRRQVMRVLDPSAARRLDQRYLPYAWGDQDLRLLGARVLHEDGSISRAPTDRGPSARIVDLPELHVGDVIDLEWRVDDLRPGLFGRYFGLDQALAPELDIPVRESQVVVLTPDELPLQFHGIHLDQAQVEAQPAETPGYTMHRWTLAQIVPRAPEANMPPAEELAPRLQASSYADWDAFGRWWWQLIEPGITVSPEMRAEVARLTEGLDSRQAKVDAIYEFVANDVRYNAWEFGIHGYQPYTAPVIFSRRFGDCKDKAILLKAMLSVIEVEAWPVLIRRVADGQHGGLRFKEDLSLALVSDFNHCIAYIPPQDGVEAGFVDGTARFHARANLPYDDEGAEVLIVRADGITRTQTPIRRETAHQREMEAKVQLAADGSADVALTLRGHGRFDAQLRQAFSLSEEDRQESAEAILASMFGPMAEGVTITVGDIEDLSAPLEVRLQGHALQFARPVEGGLELSATLSPRQMLTTPAMAGLAERHADLLLPSRSEESLHWQLRLPPGWASGPLPATVALDSEGLASYRWQAAADGGTLTIDESLAFLTTRVSTADYPRWREFARQVDRQQAAVLELAATDALVPVESSAPTTEER